MGDFKFVILKEALSLATNISGFDRWLVSARIWLQNHTATPIQWFGLSFSDVKIENVPVNLGYKPHIKLRRINHKKKHVNMKPLKKKDNKNLNNDA